MLNMEKIFFTSFIRYTATRRFLMMVNNRTLTNFIFHFKTVKRKTNGSKIDIRLFCFERCGYASYVCYICNIMPNKEFKIQIFSPFASLLFYYSIIDRILIGYASYEKCKFFRLKEI